MTYKEKCLNAAEVLYREYVQGVHIASPSSCGLCKVYRGPNRIGRCTGCPNMVFRCVGRSTLGCMYRKCQVANEESPEDINIRAAKFWKIAISFFETVDSQYFTPSGYEAEAFKELTIIDADTYQEQPVEQEENGDLPF